MRVILPMSCYNASLPGINALTDCVLLSSLLQSNSIRFQDISIPMNISHISDPYLSVGTSRDRSPLSQNRSLARPCPKGNSPRHVHTEDSFPPGRVWFVLLLVCIAGTFPRTVNLERGVGGGGGG